MAFAHLQAPEQYAGVLERVIDTLTLVLDQSAYADIIEFAESPAYLGLTLYPRQRLILKLYYRLDLTDAELADVRYLLAATDKYAKLYFPGLCAHHVLGYCSRKRCQGQEDKPDYRILNDAELRARLKDHYAHILEVIAGRRGSKSVLGAVVNSYELYKLLRDPNPQRTWGLIPGQPIGTANVATDETQALGLFGQLKALLENAPWFQKLRYRPLETLLDFPGRGLYSRSMHSNSASVRGNTLIAVNLDEFCFMNKTAGKMSDKAMWDALTPSVVTFKDSARIVITSSPFNKAGKAWDLFYKAEEGEALHVIAFQFAAWEMNPTLTKEDPELASAYMLDPDAAEIEYGGQWADQVGQYIPAEAIDACGSKDRRMATHGERGVRYTLHIDLSKRRDRCGLVICHYDKDLGKVVVDRVEEFDPENGLEPLVDPIHHEIDHEAVFAYIVRLYRQYNFRFHWISFDQFNSAWLVQALRREFGDIRGDWIDEITITDKANKEMFGNLRSLIVQGGIEYYRHLDLMKQLAQLGRTIKPSGSWKVEAPPGFHDDMADALAAAAWMCLQLALGIKSGITTMDYRKTAPADAPGDDGGLLPHSKECKATYCHYTCPRVRQRMSSALTT
jgi:hypothetical protein